MEENTRDKQITPLPLQAIYDQTNEQVAKAVLGGGIEAFLKKSIRECLEKELEDYKIEGLEVDLLDKAKESIKGKLILSIRKKYPYLI